MCLTLTCLQPGFRTDPKYLQELKLRKAKHLLVSTSQSVKEISFLLGYQSTEYFFSFFKKHTGLTPLEYRSFGREENEE